MTLQTQHKNVSDLAGPSLNITELLGGRDGGREGIAHLYGTLAIFSWIIPSPH